MADIDLFSLAKTISNSACGLVRYCLSRLNKSPYPPLPYPINVLSSTSTPIAYPHTQESINLVTDVSYISDVVSNVVSSIV